MIFGIMGHGRFGKLWAKELQPFGEVIIYDRSAGNLAELARADVLFILVPISAFESACLEVRDHISEKTLLIDACSVKLYPVAIMQKIFSASQPMLATHPLFGPDSVRRSGGLAGHKMVVCPLQCEEARFNEIMQLFRQMGLDVMQTTAEDHDRQMANSQALVHFIGRGLDALAIHEQALATPDFQALLNINKMVINDSWQLFLDMNRYNPFTREIREKLLAQLTRINNEVVQDDARA